MMGKSFVIFILAIALITETDGKPLDTPQEGRPGRIIEKREAVSEDTEALEHHPAEGRSGRIIKKREDNEVPRRPPPVGLSGRIIEGRGRGFLSEME